MATLIIAGAFTGVARYVALVLGRFGSSFPYGRSFRLVFLLDIRLVACRKRVGEKILLVLIFTRQDASPVSGTYGEPQKQGVLESTFLPGWQVF